MNEMDNIEISIGAEEQDVTDPADIDAGAEEQEVTDPAIQTEQNNGKTEADAKAAAARRKSEAELKAERERFARERATMESDLISSLGLVDSDGNIISTKEGLDKYREAQANAAIRDYAQRAGISESELSKIIEQHPDVMRAKAAQKQADVSAAKARVDEQIKEISKLDPGIKTVDDLINNDKYGQIKALVKKGYSLPDAFKITNFDRLASMKGDAGKQSAINSVNSKSHLTTTQVGAAGGTVASVPEDIKAYYRQINPGITDEEISKHWAKNSK